MNVGETNKAVMQEGVPVSIPKLRVYKHSMLLYWWPVWVTGYILALITYLHGTSVTFADTDMNVEVIMHPSRNLGVIFTVIMLLVVIITNTSVRGGASLTVIIAALALTFLFAYLDWWDEILSTFYFMAMYMNLGFYLFFSTAVLAIWLLAFFVFDRVVYYSFRPGQMVEHVLFGGGERAFDTNGMSIFKLRDDLFRHWILGLGTGDLHIITPGAGKTDIVVPNVIFIGRVLDQIQRLAAMQPDEVAPDKTIRAGLPD